MCINRPAAILTPYCLISTYVPQKVLQNEIIQNIPRCQNQIVEQVDIDHFHDFWPFVVWISETSIIEILFPSAKRRSNNQRWFHTVKTIYKIQWSSPDRWNSSILQLSIQPAPKFVPPWKLRRSVQVWAEPSDTRTRKLGIILRHFLMPLE